MSTILVAEDEAHQRLLCRMELEDDGHRVVLACDGREALHRVEEEHPDLVVLDIGMPGMDGMQVLERIMGLNSRLPVIIYTGYDMLEGNFLTWAADVFLVKSSNPDVLRTEVNRVLFQRRLEGGRIWPEQAML